MRRHLAVVFRHGDRSPTHNRYEPLARESAMEAATWAWSLPPSSVHADLNARFPVQTAHAQQRDRALGDVFGSLTALGVLQMRRLGAWASERAARGSARVRVRHVLASNFKRTQFSAQCVLSGMTLPPSDVNIRVADESSEVLNAWGTDPDLKRLVRSNGVATHDVMRNTPEEEEARRVIVAAVPAFQYLLRPFSWIAALDHTMSREGKTGGGGPLRGRTAHKRVEELFNTMDTARTGRLTKEHLAVGLKTVIQSPFSSDVNVDRLVALMDKNRDGGVDLQELKDFFQGLRLPSPSSDVGESEFWAAAKVVESAVCRRVDHILGRPAARRLTAGAFARLILDNVRAAVAAHHDDERVAQDSLATVDLYSAHDITLVPLLRELGLWSADRPWPGVASALVLEVAGVLDRDPLVAFSHWAGARGAQSGLEPHGMAIERRNVRVGAADVPTVSLSRFAEFARGL